MKKIATFLLAILTCVLISGCGSSLEKQRLERQVEREINRSDEYKAMVDELKAENAELRVENNALNINLQDYIDEVEYLENQVSDLKGQVTNSSNSDLVATIDTLNSQIASKDKEISNLKAQLSAAKNNSYSSTNNATIAELQNKINVLTLDLQNYKTLAATLQQQLDAQIAINKNQSIQSNYNSYISAIFWSDGYNYYSKKTTWYSDINCSQKLSNQDVIIISPVKSKASLSNGYTVYSCMSTTGLVYSSTSPSLYKMEDDN